jgi:leucyl-tRNA synthetase
MDGFVDNSWYFFRYLDPHNTQEFSSLAKQKLWMPIKRYSGGAEHTTVHVLYSRFLTKVLFDMGLSTVSEPYEMRLNRGIILAEDGRKMSKRWGNTVNPDEHVTNVGADAVRAYLAFIGPYNVVGSFPWSTNGLIGVRRFLERVAGLADSVTDTTTSPDIETLVQQTIKKVGEDIESMKFNTCVSALMILSNAMGDAPFSKSTYETLLTLLAPFAPHLTEELWHELGHTTSIHLEPWPKYDESKLVSDIVTIAVQVGGKSRGTVSVNREAGKEEVLLAARQDPKLGALIPANPSRIVFVPGRILNVIP